MKLGTLALIVGLGSVISLPVAAQTTEPRQTAAAVADRIRALYFDPAQGDAIAGRLEQEAATGAFDTLTDPRDLAPALSGFLRPSDAHFVVVYDPGPAPASQVAVPEPDPGLAERRANQGFRRAEILPGNIGLLDMAHFAHIAFEDPSDPARRAADAALAFLAETDAVIIDLRDNGGGAPSMVGYLTSAFTAAEAQIYNVFHSREGMESEAPTVFHPKPRLTVPLYVLISGRTGSAAEALPYTLQAAGRATIVGEASAGAANPGGLVPVGDGFLVFVSQGSPRNPVTGRNWEGTGVVPDLPTASDQAQTLAYTTALRAIVAGDADRRDARWALEALTPEGDDPDRAAYIGTYGDYSVAEVQNRLLLKRGRRPSLSLKRLDADLYSVVTDPGRRVRFLRDENGGVEGLEVEFASGDAVRARRLNR